MPPPLRVGGGLFWEGGGAVFVGGFWGAADVERRTCVAQGGEGGVFRGGGAGLGVRNLGFGV